MNEMGKTSPPPERRSSGCGLLNAVFGRRRFWLRRSTSTGSLSLPSIHIGSANRHSHSKRRRGGSTSLDNPTLLDPVQKQLGGRGDRIITRPGPKHQPRAAPVVYQTRKAPMEETTVMARGTPAQSYGRRAGQVTMGLSGELESMIFDHQRSKGASTLVRASSGNVMLYGNLGNLRQPGGTTTTTRTTGKFSNCVIGNVLKTKPPLARSGENGETEEAKPNSLCRALSTRMDPEQLKILGNEDYKNGRFEAALALYDAAISIDPNKASYRSNKSAALTALGRLLEAVFECREAIRIEPFYQRAHNRLAALYIRLGEAEKAMYHFKQAGLEAEPEVIEKAKKLQLHLNKCTDAKRQRDWNTVVKATTLALSAGADSALQIFALKSEALLKLHRHQEAGQVLSNAPNFLVDDCTKFFGPIDNATVLVVQALVHMSSGRFDEAVNAAEKAIRLDPNNKEAKTVCWRTRAVAHARSKGNDLFKAARYSEACVAYGEGLGLDIKNSILLCNRAACYAKLGQYDRAVEDCTTALHVRPSYCKARLRRAECNSKLEKWDASIQDLELLMKESATDKEEVRRSLKEAQEQLKLRQGGDGGSKDVSSSSNSGGGHGLILVSSKERFRDYVASPGVSVVYFYNKPGDEQLLQHMEQLHERHQSVNFLRVEVEDQADLAKAQGVSSTPVLRIYKHGSKAKEIQGDKKDLLETSIIHLLS